MGELIAGRVELLDPLGRGAAGAVWRAVDRRRGGICAAKVMRQRDSADIIRFLREQSAGARHRGGIGAHRHLLTPYAWVADEDDVVLLMPLARGGTLAEALGDHGALAPALVAELLRQLLDGLAAVHAAGWVHRDVTPANLMLEATGTARPHLRLADFGIALRLGEPRMTALGHVPGTPGFIAPEILRGGPVSTAQDVWAAGAVALTALDPLLELTGTAADERARPAGEALDRLLPERGEPRADALREALLRMLDADPEARPGAAEAREALPAPAGPAGDWALTAEGEVFEVFDQIESWSDESSGPEPARPAGAPVSAPVSSSALAPNPASAPNPVPAQKPAPVPSPQAPRTTVLAPPPGSAQAPAPAPGPTSAPAPGRTPGPGAGRPGRALPVMLFLLAGAALVTAVLLGVLAAGTEEPAPSPTALAGSGEPCGWHEEGRQSAASDGTTLTCVRGEGDRFTWEAE